MTRKILLLASMLFGSALIYAQTTISGTINDGSLGEPLPGANIKVSSKAVGTTTDFNGKFTLKVTDTPPFSIEVSSLGYETETLEITKNNQIVTINLKENATSLDEIVISASRTPERIIESPVTIERFDTRDIKNTASANFYDGLENLKGVDINTNSLTYKSVNTRGFASFANERFVQLVDGMDTASPALNFSLGNLLGLSELDVKSVEILPGASSALYGANAFNGILLITGKNPFDDQGVSFQAKGGVTSQEAAGTNDFYDITVRVAHKFNEYFAAKASVSYLSGEEWHATDNRNTAGIGEGYLPGFRETDDFINDQNEYIINGNEDDRNSATAFDGANIYGDEVVTNIRTASGLGIIPDVEVSRTGYREVDLLNNDAESIKFGGSLHFRPYGDERLEIIANSKFGLGNTVYQGQNRYSIRDFLLQQHRLELKGKNFFVRSYFTSEDAGDSYDTRFTAININRLWKSNEDWFGDYIAAYAGASLTNPALETGALHQIARTAADTGRFEPGTEAFQNALNTVTSDADLETGSRFRDNTSLIHTDANLNLSDYIDWAEIQVGGSYRQYRLNSFGTIYTDADSPIVYDEFGIYTQLQKKVLDDRLKITASARFDKSQNFDGNVSPRLSLAYAAGEQKNHNFRAAFQTGFRNPSTQDQYIGLFTGAGHLIGTVDENLDRFSTDFTTSNLAPATIGETVTLTGRDVHLNSFSRSSVESGENQKSNFNLVTPEEVISVEVGYRGAIPTGENKLTVDFSAYYNDYTDFISVQDVLTPLYGSFNADGSADNLAVQALENGDVATFSVRTNSQADISSYGLGLGLNTKVFNGYKVGLNYTWSKFDFDQASDPDFDAAFNTPEHKVKLEFGHPNVFKNFGFNINFRWQNEFLWESTFSEGIVEDRTTVDAQINYKVPSLKSTFKLGGVNLSGKEYISAPGAGAVGSQYYLSWTINN